MKNIAIAVLLLFLGFSLFAQTHQSNLITNTNARNYQSLNGSWDIIVDPYETGYYNHRYLPSDDGYFKDAQMKNSWDLVEYNFETSQKLQVPGDWNTQDDKLFFYEGTMWYRKVFDFNKNNNNRAFLYFGAVNYETKVYLNGEFVGDHVGGFTPFNFEVTDKIKNGRNFVILKVDNKRKRDGVPTVNTDWWNYGGLTRDVKIITTPETFIQDYFVQLEKGNTKKIKGWVKLNGMQFEQNVTITIPEAGISKNIETDENGYGTFEIKSNLTLWSPENPKLYKVAIKSETDEIKDEIGFRTIEVKGEDILLNGKSIFLRGICIHEETPFNGGRANSAEDAKILLGWAKDMNCNFVRLAHYPHNEYMTRMADKMGIMVWSEIPVYWTIYWDNPDVYANAENQLQDMIHRDKNKASVILWSVANETPVNDTRLIFLSNLAEKARSIDPTRLITAALDTQTSDEEGGRVIDDPLGEVVDVIGINNYCGWYGPAINEVDCGASTWKNKYQKPMIMSEFGGGALQGYHGDENDRWTEEYQMAVYEENLEMIKNISFLRGTTPWILKDFRSARRPLPDIQDYWNRKGVISERGIKKKSFFIMKEFYEGIKKKWD